MSKVALRMKNKKMSKIHLDSSGQMAITAVQAASDLASKGISAQPANPLTVEENKGNPGPLPSERTSLAGTEVSTGGPAERVAPETVPEADKQPAPKDLEQSPAKDSLPVAEATPEPAQPAVTATEPAPHEKVPAATADKVLKTESANLALPSGDASASMSPAAAEAALEEK